MVLLTTVQTVTINDLGGRTFTHPLIAYDLTSEYSYQEIRNSSDLGIELDAGNVSIISDTVPVLTSAELAQVEPQNDLKYGTPNFPPDFNYQNVQVVQTLANFPAPVGNEIILEDKTYLIDAIKLDITGYCLVFGQRSAIQGFNQNVSSIQSFENGGLMFKSTTNLFMNDIEVYLSAPNLTLFDHQGDGTTPEGESFEINKMAVYCQDDNGAFQTGCKAGLIKDIRQGFMGTQFFLGFADGFRFSGTWTNGGMRITDTLWRAFAIMGQTGKVYYSDATTPVVFESRFSSNANIQVNGSSVAYDFPQTAFTFDGQYQLQNGNASGSGTFVSLWSGNHPSTYPEANFKDNTGITNSFAGVEWISTTDNLVTIATQNLWYKIPVSAATVKDATWVTYSNGEVTYNSDNVLDASTITRISAVGKSNDIVEIKIVKEDALAVQTDLIVATITIQGSAAQGRAENVTIPTTAMLTKDDKLSVWVRNTSGTTDVTILEGANFILGQK
jgi:hypothetical protein